MTTDRSAACPRCRHAAHDGGVCFNMASDTDCPCRYSPGSHPSLTAPALSTPPADDIREAVAVAIWNAPADLERAVLGDCRLIADAVVSSPGVEVRPRGTVTDAERVSVIEEILRYKLLPANVREYLTGYAEAIREVIS